MKMPTKSYWQVSWCVLIAVIALASLFSGEIMHKPPLNAYIDSGWAHFFAYMAAAALPLLAWKRRTGLVVSLGVAVLSIVFQALRGIIAGSPVDLNAIVINLFGIIAGILLGFNIITHRARSKEQLTLGAGERPSQ
jgi:choline-glycine betaine transporter